jgi:twitching motility protein PilT
MLIATESVRAIIRENKMAQLTSAIQTGKKYGMQLLEDNLNELVAADTISHEQAMSKANVPDVIKERGGAMRATAGLR